MTPEIVPLVRWKDHAHPLTVLPSGPEESDPEPIAEAGFEPAISRLWALRDSSSPFCEYR